MRARVHRRRASAPGALLVLLLTACQTSEAVETPDDAPAVSEATAGEQDAPAAAPGTEAPADEPTQPVAEPTPEPVPETAALPPEPQIDDDPQRLIGLDRGALDALLGSPVLIRREAPAQVWQYQAATCVFDVFLYEQDGAHRVSYVEARDPAAQRIDARDCLNQLLRARLGLGAHG